MTPGRFLHRLAHGCSDRVRLNILEPLVADLHHEWSESHSPAGRLVVLGRGYGAFWRSFAWCFACDAWSRESREFNHKAATAFVVAIGATAALEWLLMHANETVRVVVVHNIRYLWLSAHRPLVGDPRTPLHHRRWRSRRPVWLDAGSTWPGCSSGDDWLVARCLGDRN